MRVYAELLRRAAVNACSRHNDGWCRPRLRSSEVSVPVQGHVTMELQQGLGALAEKVVLEPRSSEAENEVCTFSKNKLYQLC